MPLMLSLGALKRVALLLGVALVAGAVTFLVLFDPDDVIDAERDRWIPALRHRLGRDVSVGAIDTALWPELGAEVRDVVIHGQRPGDPPLLRLKRARVHFALWSAIRSAGTDLRVTGVTLEGLEVNLVRRADGSLSYADVVGRLRRGPPREGAPPDPMRPEVRRFLQNLRLDAVTLVDAAVRLRDEATGGAPVDARIDQINLDLRDVALVSPIELTLRAAALADAPNVMVNLRFGPLPIGRKGPTPLHHVRFEADDLDLSGLAPYLGDAAPVRIDSARLTARLDVRDPLAREGKTRVRGALDVSDLAVGGGAPFHLHVEPTFDLDLKSGVFALDGLVVALDDMRLTADGTVRGFLFGWPVFDGVAVRTEGLQLDRLLSHLPDLARRLPAGLELAGPASLAITGGGTLRAQQAQVRLELEGARVRVPGLLDKPAGVALDLQAAAQRSSDAVKVERLQATLGPMAVRLSGQVENFEAPRYRLEGGTGAFAIDALVKLLPGVRDAIPDDVTFAGTGEVHLRAAGGPGALDAGIEVRLTEADVRLPAMATVTGGGTFEATAKGDPGVAVDVAATVDLGALAVETENLRKPAGVPWRAATVARVEPTRATILTLKATLGPAAFAGAGGIERSTRRLALAGDLATFPVATVADLLPALPLGPLRAARLGGRLSVAGDPTAPGTLAWSLRDLEATLGRAGRVSGWARVTGGALPTAAFELTAAGVDLDALTPREAAPAWVQRLTGEGKLMLETVRAAGAPVASWAGTLALRDGRARIEPAAPDLAAALAAVVYGPPAATP